MGAIEVAMTCPECGYRFMHAPDCPLRKVEAVTENEVWIACIFIACLWFEAAILWT